MSEGVVTPRETVQLRLHGLQIIYNEVMASSQTTTVRVRRADSERLAAIARRRKATVVDVLHFAIDALERQEFLHGLDEDAQRMSPAQREALRAEQQDWDALA